MNMAVTQILQKKSDVLDTIQHNTLLIFKYPCIIGHKYLEVGTWHNHLPAEVTSNVELITCKIYKRNHIKK